MDLIVPFLIGWLIGIVILVVSMVLTSQAMGGVEFGTIGMVIGKAAALLLVVEAAELLLPIPWNWVLSIVLWWGGLMLLYGLDFWEARTLVFITFILTTLVNLRDRYAVVEPGVVNLWLTNHLKPHGYHFAPDPSSQGACTIGGNVATNSGGPHTLKYGVTVNHVLGLEIVLPDGRVVQTGGPVEDVPGYDLTGVIVGSEGTFGLATQVWVRITRHPEAYRTLLGVFETVDDATNTISDIIGAGMIRGALEVLDR